jgi:hypothetical protein
MFAPVCLLIIDDPAASIRNSGISRANVPAAAPHLIFGDSRCRGLIIPAYTQQPHLISRILHIRN